MQCGLGSHTDLLNMVDEGPSALYAAIIRDLKLNVSKLYIKLIVLKYVEYIT